MYTGIKNLKSKSFFVKILADLAERKNMPERWAPLDDQGFAGYSISDLGQVRNDKTDRLIKTSTNQRGIVKVNLVEMPGWPPKTVSVARLVATAFLPPPPDDAYDTPVHLDGDYRNVNASNLMWRPRWFAVRYHKQRNGRLHKFKMPIVCIDTDEVFEDCREAAETYGMLELDIFMDITNQRGVWPHRYYFALLDENYWEE